MMNSEIMWQGAGWYAPRQERGVVRYFFCGDNRAAEPNTYGMGLGTPEWFDAPPAGAEIR
jgi:hypothetical protein